MTKSAASEASHIAARVTSSGSSRAPVERRVGGTGLGKGGDDARGGRLGIGEHAERHRDRGHHPSLRVDVDDRNVADQRAGRRS